MGTAAVIGILGIWMVIAPLVPMSINGKFWNDWIVGLIVINVALILTSSHDWGRRLAAAVGIWVCVSSFMPRLLAGRSMATSDLIAGILLVVAALEVVRYSRHEGPVPIDGDVG